MVCDVWRAKYPSSKDSSTENLINKMRILRSRVKDWQIQKKKKVSLELMKIEEELKEIAKGMASHKFAWNNRVRIWELRKRKQKILQMEEISWRLKSRVTWLREGDKNTKFFHRFASKRRVSNAIWKIKNEEEATFHSYEDISKEAINYFKKAYSRDANRSIEDIMWGIEPFPKMFEEEENSRLYAAVSGEELLSVMKSFKKDKCPGPDGWTIDIFIHFFEMMKNDILGMVEETRIKGKIHHIISSTYIALISKKKGIFYLCRFQADFSVQCHLQNYIKINS